MKNLQSTLARREADKSRIETASGSFDVIYGRIRVSGQGQFFYYVQFPVGFTEMPLFTYGHELAQGQDIDGGSAPMCSASVQAWKLLTKESKPLYIGADVVGVVTNSTDSFVHVKFEGVALKNPIAPSLSVKARI